MDTHQCPKCERHLPIQLRPDTMHHGSIRCPEHGFAWIPKPKQAAAPKQRQSRCLISSLHPDMRDFCWECLRSKQRLSTLRPSVSLQVHHIIPVAEGGGDEPHNLMLLCAECHVEHHRRRSSFIRYEQSTGEVSE